VGWRIRGALSATAGGAAWRHRYGSLPWTLFLSGSTDCRRPGRRASTGASAVISLVAAVGRWKSTTAGGPNARSGPA